MRRNRFALATAGLVLGAAAFAWDGGAQERPTLLTAAHPGEPGPAGGQAPDDQERRARRAALRTCLQQAGEDRPARRACFARAGAGARPGSAEGSDGRHHRGPGAFHRGLPGALGRAVHGTVIVPDGAGGFEEVTFDRGRVDAASDSSKIVLDRPDGPEVSLALTPDTKYHGIDNAGALVDGRPALVVSRDGKALHVMQKVPRPPAHGGKDGGNNQAPPVVPND